MEIATIAIQVLDRIEETGVPYIKNWCTIHKTTDRLEATLARIPEL